MNLRYIASEGYFYPVFLIAVVVIGVLSIIDLGVDVSDGAPIAHVAAESTIVLIALAGALILVHHLVNRAGKAQSTAASLARRLVASDRDRARWRREAQGLLQGLGVVMAQQFEAWELTPAEKEIALLLLKGLSHKEIAAARGVSEATARQQARSVYRKGKLSGRRDLAAFFLEDISLPAQSGTPKHGSGSGDEPAVAPVSQP